MRHQYVKDLVNKANSKHFNFVDDICEGNLPKALEITILNMVLEGRYSTNPSTFGDLSDALHYLNQNGHWSK